ncbi:peptide-methionine (S)-S-oxide reductase MsrA [Lysobacter sp. KIS68-7]|uniref:peptide-methionine (S)-S-oxide reductase MsrA n=1 Tax=Lysobacter sp. KIS68-7 TaxID=2904252 RepID=UPI001E2C34A6|nr:peptide-methionine (S)-S-oxide reductase MsrA [Lysobacter sp. KIS68-7]UHQ19192.1 peptide-methionine (S)-S-oxide reductase MsrA [Lysobacter sp. KIS68-7]
MQVASEKIVAGAAAAGVVVLLLAGLSTIRNPAIAASQAVAVPAMVETGSTKLAAPTHPETVVFAGGCFWGVQGVFEHVKGVQRAVSGYIGGAASTAHYELVSTGTTGHAESVQVTYDPSQVSYAQLMRVFFSVVHDPTELNYQGPDHGTQYRSAIYTTTPAQLQATKAYIAQLSKAGTFRAPIVTLVAMAKPFYAAEDYHQDYMALNPEAAYIRYWDAPKLAALKSTYPTLYRARPVLAN